MGRGGQGKVKNDEEYFSIGQNKEESINYDKRTLKEVLLTDLQNFVYFFFPLVVTHILAWSVKPFFTDDPRGPWEILWNKVIDTFGGDTYFYYVWANWICIQICYWGVSSMYAFMDFTQRPKFLMKYKIQPGKNEPVAWNKFWHMVYRVFLNDLMFIPALMIEYKRWITRTSGDVREVPTTLETFTVLLVSMLFHDVIFYHSHRLLHHKKIYKYFHKMHHEWQSPVAATATYAHPLEHFVTGVISPGVGIYLLSPAIPAILLWNCWIIVQTLNDHSGYHFPLVFSPEMHDYHHLKFHTCYGWLSFWDWFYGTDIAFQKTEVHKDRHIRIHSAMSAREMFPDKKTR